MTVFLCEEEPVHPCGQHIAAIIKLLADFASIPGATLLDISPKMLPPNGTLSCQIMRDFCHPEERGYQVRGDALAPLLSLTN